MIVIWQIRNMAEAATNDNFFDPWKARSDDEVTRLGKLLAGLKETNLKIAGENRGEAFFYVGQKD